MKKSNTARLSDCKEIFFASLLYRWEQTAPENNHIGDLDGRRAKNSQSERYQYVFKILFVGIEEVSYRKLNKLLIDSKGQVYISKEKTHLKHKKHIKPLKYNWWIDTCLSSEAKEQFLFSLKHFGFSNCFISSIISFVRCESIKDCFPTESESKAIINKEEARLADDNV